MFEWLKLARLMRKTTNADLERRLTIVNERRRLERQVAQTSGKQYAESLDFPVQWDCGAPMPHLFVSDNQALLAFLIAEPQPSRDGSYSTARNPEAECAESLALIAFEHCLSAKLGAPNDEVFSGHPLSGKGLQPYSAQRVVKSKWLEELEKINSVHERYNPAHWRGLNHYVFWFKDSTFECIARSFKVETY